MQWRHAWYTPGYQQAIARQGVCRLQVAVRATGLLSNPTISSGASPTADPRPLLCDILLPADVFCRNDGRWVGWEWWQDSGQPVTVSVHLNGTPHQYHVQALPDSETGIVADHQQASALHTGVWLNRREIRLAGYYPAQGFILEDISERDVVAGARCDLYDVSLHEGRLRLRNLTNLQELAEGTPVEALVVLTLLRHGL